MTLSLCMIAKDCGAFLDTCLGSVEKFVDEIVLVDTGSSDDTVLKAQAHGAKVIVCNHETHPDWFLKDEDTGKYFLSDFAAARNLSYEKSSGDYQFWIDADDTVEQAGCLRAVVADMKKNNIQVAYFTYNYAFDALGNVVCQLQRERINQRGYGTWVSPIHEVRTRPGGHEKLYPGVLIKHHRDLPDFKGLCKETKVKDRNYKILKHLYDKSEGKLDARSMFYLGNESRYTHTDDAIGYYEDCIKKSDLASERTDARMIIGQIYESRNKLEMALRCYAAASVDFPGSPDPWFSLARMAYAREQWAQCCEFTEHGFALKDSHTLSISNPLDRTWAPHLYYNFALNKLGRVKEALDSCNAALAIAEETHLRHNRNRYMDHLSPYTAPVKASSQGLSICIWTGQAVEPWDADTPDLKGIGGSETACVKMAQEFTKLGHSVVVFSDCTRPGKYDGVVYERYTDFESRKQDYDLFVCSRQAWAMNQISVHAAMKVLWVHDIHCNCPDELVKDRLPEFDKILCLSEWHREFFLKHYPYLNRAKVITTRNGIITSRFQNPQLDRPNRLIYTSDAPRGLDHLLDLFPRIQAQVPDVELDVYHGLEGWRACAKNNPPEMAKIDALEAKMGAIPGVHHIGRVNQQVLAEAMLGSKVWSYPTMFLETYCISAIEAQAAGCVPVTTALAALKETVRSGFKLEPPVDDRYDEAFIGHVVSLLKDDELRAQHMKRGIEFASQLSWETVAKDWLKMYDSVVLGDQVRKAA